MGNGVITITGGRVLRGADCIKDGVVVFEGGTIGYAGPAQDSPAPKGRLLHAAGNYVSAGFIDLHMHGGGGKNFLDGRGDSFRDIAATHARYGTTCLLATLGVAPLDVLCGQLSLVRRLREEGRGGSILGVHLEGPYINPAQAGAHPRQHIRPFDQGSLNAILDCAGGVLKMMTLAPEIEGVGTLIELLIARGIVCAAGHSNAGVRESRAAFDAGVRHVTHLFNAMSGLHHRQPGLAAAALMDDRVTAELIVDGVHLHPLMVNIALRVKGWSGVLLVTDCMKALDSDGGELTVGGRRISVRDGAAYLEDGTLCGTMLTMNRAVRNVREFTGASLGEVVKLATINPARVLGLEGRKGSLDAGKDADIIIFDDDINMKTVIIGGEVVYNEGSGVEG